MLKKDQRHKGDVYEYFDGNHHGKKFYLLAAVLKLTYNDNVVILLQLYAILRNRFILCMENKKRKAVIQVKWSVRSVVLCHAHWTFAIKRRSFEEPMSIALSKQYYSVVTYSRYWWCKEQQHNAFQFQYDAVQCHAMQCKSDRKQEMQREKKTSQLNQMNLYTIRV